MNSKISRKGISLIDTFKKQTEELAFISQQDMKNWAAIRHNYEISRKALINYIEELEQNKES
jgi:hypothetical protein